MATTSPKASTLEDKISELRPLLDARDTEARLAANTPTGQFFQKALQALRLSYSSDILNDPKMVTFLGLSLLEIDTTIRKAMALFPLSQVSLREPLNLEYAPFSFARQHGVPIAELPKDDERRLIVQSLFLFALRLHIAPKYQTLESFLDAYPSFKDRPNIEQLRLRGNANWFDLVFYTLPPKNNKTFLMNLVPRICEGNKVRYVTGSGETMATSDRVAIYRSEGNCQKISRPPRKRNRENVDSDTKANLDLFQSIYDECRQNETDGSQGASKLAKTASSDSLSSSDSQGESPNAERQPVSKRDIFVKKEPKSSPTASPIRSVSRPHLEQKSVSAPSPVSNTRFAPQIPAPAPPAPAPAPISSTSVTGQMPQQQQQQQQQPHQSDFTCNYRFVAADRAPARIFQQSNSLGYPSQVSRAAGFVGLESYNDYWMRFNHSSWIPGYAAFKEQPYVDPRYFLGAQPKSAYGIPHPSGYESGLDLLGHLAGTILNPQINS